MYMMIIPTNFTQVKILHVYVGNQKEVFNGPRRKWKLSRQELSSTDKSNSNKGKQHFQKLVFKLRSAAERISQTN